MARKEYMARYIRTLNGFIKIKYNRMRRRVMGQDEHGHIYKGLPLLPREDFYEWVKTQKELPAMFDAYEKSGWAWALCPSIDRVNPKNGYVIGNMRFITMKENADAGRINSAKIRSRRKTI